MRWTNVAWYKLVTTHRQKSAQCKIRTGNIIENNVAELYYDSAVRSSRWTRGIFRNGWHLKKNKIKRINEKRKSYIKKKDVSIISTACVSSRVYWKCAFRVVDDCDDRICFFFFLFGWTAEWLTMTTVSGGEVKTLFKYVHGRRKETRAATTKKVGWNGRSSERVSLLGGGCCVRSARWRRLVCWLRGVVSVGYLCRYG